MFKPALIVTGLALAGLVLPASAAPNAQLVNSVQQRMNVLGFRDVDVSQLTSHQIVALHLKLQGPSNSGIRKKQDIRAILRWDGRERNHSVDKTN
ncbi:MAG: hypothetical protein ABJN34_07210 [Litoreibacter sp.]|uniref:hypothetical protein n=1 Tax=Litoreibacter sp. TaxID=1969459 RepID=UPI0032994915